MEEKENSKALTANILLLFATMIWGVGNLFQKMGSQYLGPITFYGFRSLIGSLTLVILVFLTEKSKNIKEKKLNIKHTPYGKEYFKKLFKIAPLCVMFNILGNICVQAGIKFTSISKAGFLTSVYIVFVPIFSALFFKKKVGILSWIGTAVAVIGLYLLCITGEFHIEMGDALILGCAMPFAIHIILVGKYVKIFNPLHFTCVEFATSGILCSTCGLLFETSELNMVNSFLPSILFCGIMGTGVCFALQSTAQKHTSPTVAALLMSLESVFSAITGFIVLHESFTLREVFGVILIFSAVVLAQVPLPKKKNEIK